MLCEGGRCPVGQATIKQEQQCKTMEQKQRANYYFKSINQYIINNKIIKKNIILNKKKLNE